MTVAWKYFFIISVTRTELYLYYNSDVSCRDTEDSYAAALKPTVALAVSICLDCVRGECWYRAPHNVHEACNSKTPNIFCRTLQKYSLKSIRYTRTAHETVILDGNHN